MEKGKMEETAIYFDLAKNAMNFDTDRIEISEHWNVNSHFAPYKAVNW